MFCLKDIVPSDFEGDRQPLLELMGFPNPNDQTPNQPLRVLTDSELLAVINHVTAGAQRNTINEITSDDLYHLIDFVQRAGWDNAYAEGRQVVLSTGREAKQGFGKNSTLRKASATAQAYVSANFDKELRVSVYSLLKKIVPIAETACVVELEYLGYHDEHGIFVSTDSGVLKIPATGNRRERVISAADGDVVFRFNVETANLVYTPTLPVMTEDRTYVFLATYTVKW